jgi:hypothetical protein
MAMSFRSKVLSALGSATNVLTEGNIVPQTTTITITHFGIPKIVVIMFCMVFRFPMDFRLVFVRY